MELNARESVLFAEKYDVTVIVSICYSVRHLYETLS